jgi:hypothetical protein
LEKTGEAMKNGQSRDTGNIGSVGGYFDMKLKRRCGDISVWKHF